MLQRAMSSFPVNWSQEGKKTWRNFAGISHWTLLSVPGWLAWARAAGNLFQVLSWMCISHTHMLLAVGEEFSIKTSHAYTQKAQPKQNTALPTLFLPKEKPRAQSKHTQELVYLLCCCKVLREGKDMPSLQTLCWLLQDVVWDIFQLVAFSLLPKACRLIFNGSQMVERE